MTDNPWHYFIQYRSYTQPAWRKVSGSVHLDGGKDLIAHFRRTLQSQGQYRLVNGNNGEEVFADPAEFDVTRNPATARLEDELEMLKGLKA